MNFIKRTYRDSHSYVHPTQSPPQPSSTARPSILSSSQLPQQSCSMTPTVQNTSASHHTSSSSSTGSVRFIEMAGPQKYNDREKYLTAKYPQQQMQLIRKRLKVEFWVDDQLRNLYDIKDDSACDDHDHCPGDIIDSLLDIDNEQNRRYFLLDKLKNAKQPKPKVMEFVDEVLHRVKML
ncbi:unnamed protein product [Didymodactylos carnosus]|uniref:Uncharacterized protein n=1 Tax=Didymodactylos carnosus TaxID=1234261 RepID=A0A813TF25_9BILA|nr:unnamed protein product [Didymodactylos carnosus]CAF0808849.1 unnamed protein product [Didymodactylos carnosus]CAF3558966.1 unnamed protein product [Didymodactylos carnosus]CAF3594377.1 unnamed protein product [Didymodactylos carnosus]